ncbi:Uncharacterized protein OBRU01_14462, partial [Operophtera brumata]
VHWEGADRETPILLPRSGPDLHAIEEYLGEIPNTYTFTKQLAEHVVYEQRGQLPASISVSLSSQWLAFIVYLYLVNIGIFI